MKKAKKILVMVAALALTAALAIGGTLAYLTSQDAVTNTFTVGNVKIVLDEQDTDDSATDVTIPDERDKKNEYHLLPGHTYVKDPLITVTMKDAKYDAYKSNFDSEDCYLFVKVENGIVNIEAEGNTTIAAQMETIGWKPIAEGSNIYCYCDKDGEKQAVNAGDQIHVFDSFTIKGDVDNTELAGYVTELGDDGEPVEDAVLIDVVAYAVQIDGFADKTPAQIWADAKFA